MVEGASAEGKEAAAIFLDCSKCYERAPLASLQAILLDACRFVGLRGETQEGKIAMLSAQQFVSQSCPLWPLRTMSGEKKGKKGQAGKRAEVPSDRLPGGRAFNKRSLPPFSKILLSEPKARGP